MPLRLAVMLRQVHVSTAAWASTVASLRALSKVALVLSTFAAVRTRSVTDQHPLTPLLILLLFPALCHTNSYNSNLRPCARRCC